MASTHRPLTSLAGLAILSALAVGASAAEHFVAPGGSPQAAGTRAEPWDLATALAGPALVQPGDTIWLTEGIYRGGFVSRLAGHPARPIMVRAEPGSRVTIDTQPRDDRDNGLLMLWGADVVFRDFEVTCSHPRRATELAGSWPADIRRGAVDVRGDRLSLVNLVIHDQANGVAFWSDGEGGIVSGCLIYNNGWQGPDRGHGHGIYAQNARGTKRILDNVIFHQFAYGIHAYGSEKASLKGFDIEGNIVFENGCLSRGGNAAGILVGGACPAERIAIRDNVVVAGNVRLGYPWGATSEDVLVTGNYCDHGLVVRDFRRATVMRNTIVAHSNVAQLESAERLLLDGLRWDENDYFVTDGRWGQFAVVEGTKRRGMTFEQWRMEHSIDAISTFTKGEQTALRIVVRPNMHEAGRAHIAVLNPRGLAEVAVDLSEVLTVGQAYRIVSAKNFYGPALLSGVYESGSVRIPMNPAAAALPVGMPDAMLPVTEPHFAAFVLLPGRGS
ncbi:MAG TPA: right-handed parallel beta-helix repeat-containing protein [Pirellulaceae bacterium]|nr:right-handed parallel beta-helix repeat-containing protein [Pirellulaceae bacterium]